MTARTDRLTRNLAALERTGATTRVLNLVAVEREHGDNPDYGASPFFSDRTLNRAIVLKHRLRTDEQYIFDNGRLSTTKLIIPFAAADLKLGGRSIFVGQPGWVELLGGACGATPNLDRDVHLLETLDELGSLDPFLLRDRLQRSGFSIAQCYFSLSPADRTSMRAFVAEQIRQLVAIALGDVGPAADIHTVKLANALLSSEVDERLEPLRQTLRLEGDAYREGMFGWRGFLYHKWLFGRLRQDLSKVVREMGELVVSGAPDREATQLIEAARARLRRSIPAELGRISTTVGIYDRAFGAMLAQAEPQPFVQFLRQAPAMFASLGERVGAMAHIASFWRYRFPEGRPLRAPIEEAASIFTDFEEGLALELAA